MNTFELIKVLTPRQKFIAFVIVAIISATTSLGTAYFKGSDCTEISEKYVGSIKNYNELIEITEQTQKKYIEAKKDILQIQEQLLGVINILSESERTYTQTSSTITENSYAIDTLNLDGMILANYQPSSIIKENTIITKVQTPERANCILDSLVQITHKYDNE